MQDLAKAETALSMQPPQELQGQGTRHDDAEEQRHPAAQPIGTEWQIFRAANNPDPNEAVLLAQTSFRHDVAAGFVDHCLRALSNISPLLPTIGVIGAKILRRSIVVWPTLIPRCLPFVIFYFVVSSFFFSLIELVAKGR